MYFPFLKLRGRGKGSALACKRLVQRFPRETALFCNTRRMRPCKSKTGKKKY